MFILDSFWDKIGGAIVDALRSLMLSLCDIIYRLIVFFFDIFMTLGNAQILGEITLSEFYTRVGLILGLFMIFRVTFSLIQYVINPDLMVDKQKGLFNIVKRIFIVIVLLGITRPIFNFAYDVQKEIITSNVIPKVVTGKNINAADSGTSFAWYTFNAFYSFDQNYVDSVDSDTFSLSCPELSAGLIEKDFKNSHSFRFAYNCVNKRAEIKSSEYDEGYYTYIIEFDGHGLLAVVVGLIVLFMIIMYVIQVGVRVVQLAYLQLIAPIPIIGYLAPKGEDTLNKWFKQCVTTYLDFFIRVAILYFVVFIISFLTDTSSDNYKVFIKSIGDFGESNLELIIIIMIIALLLFASKVPKLLKEIFPSLGGGAASFNFGLSPKKVFNDTLAARAIGGAVGAVGAGASNAIHGFMNVKKSFKDNGGLKSGKAWGAAVGAGLKGTVSVAGGVFGGAKAGLKTKDISKTGEAVKTANKNRTEREQKAESGYHWYNPFPAMGEKILEFAGEPGAADAVKNKQQAIREEKQKEQKFSKGANIASNYTYKTGENKGKLNTDAAFSNQKFRDSYKAVSDAKTNLGKAELQLEQAQSNLHAAYNLSPNDPERESKIVSATDIYEKAKKNHKSMSGQLDLAKAKHDSNRKIYARDAEVEDDFKYWKDINEIQEGYKEIDELKLNDSKKSNAFDEEILEGNETDDGQVTMEEYMNMDQQVSDANIEVANAIANQPDAIAETRERFLEAEKARDELAERLSHMSNSTPIETNVPNINLNVSAMSKSELSQIKGQLERRYRELNRQYNILEKKIMNNQPVDTAKFSEIKAERQNVIRELEKVNNALR